MKQQQGFTLIETLIAIFLLTLTVGGLLELAAGGFYSVRYARNQLVADALLQESLEYFHNSRDTAVQNTIDWPTWLASFNVDSSGTQIQGSAGQGCFSSNGCIVDPYATNQKVKACSSTCAPIVFYTSNDLYGYTSSTYPSQNGQTLNTASPTTYVRTITLQQSSPDQVTIVSKVQWLNGSAQKSTSQSILLTRWQ
ncbi:MAG: prepilin-type N-terminal cleavage/methylation domain-containing protein [Candidatus Paceibacterota bacterium]